MKALVGAFNKERALVLVRAFSGDGAVKSSRTFVDSTDIQAGQHQHSHHPSHYLHKKYKESSRYDRLRAGPQHHHQSDEIYQNGSYLGKLSERTTAPPRTPEPS